MTKIAIIGAGFAGLTIAKLLTHKAEVTIFEKSKGVGGRMATRYAQEWEFDHGAPLFNVASLEFNKFLQTLLKDNILAKWNIRFAHNNLSPKIYNPSLPSAQYFVGTSRMNSISKYLAADLDVKLETKIITLEKTSNKWKLTDEKSQEYQGFDIIITATPPLQAAEILPANCSYTKNIKEIEMLPSFAVMLGFDNNVMQSKSWDVAYFHNSPIDLIVANHHKPFRNTKPSFVICTNHSWAKENIDIHKDEVAKNITTELENIFNEKLDPSIIQVHRWLYARSQLRSYEEPFFADQENGLISCGDWCIGENVEDAFSSGLAVVSYLKEVLPDLY